MREDITKMGDDELSYQVFNTEPLLRAAEEMTERELVALLRENFVFTKEQINIAVQDVRANLSY